MSQIEASIDKQAIHESFLAWQADEESLNAELIESLAALEAYQSHLDEWQRQLASEREALRVERENLRQADETDQPPAGVSSELEEARQQIASLTEELQTRDQTHGDLLAELEHLRVQVEESQRGHGPPPANSVANHSARPASPVLGSIAEQFGKLRQQRALDRQAGKQSK